MHLNFRLSMCLEVCFLSGVLKCLLYMDMRDDVVVYELIKTSLCYVFIIFIIHCLIILTMRCGGGDVWADEYIIIPGNQQPGVRTIPKQRQPCSGETRNFCSEAQSSNTKVQSNCNKAVFLAILFPPNRVWLWGRGIAIKCIIAVFLAILWASCEWTHSRIHRPRIGSLFARLSFSHYYHYCIIMALMI